MLVDSYHTNNDGHILFSRNQASDFAKHIADDFNPLHDIDAKRFCVPGDLLFAIVCSTYGIHQHMHFEFADMVSDGVALALPAAATTFSLADKVGKEYLKINCAGSKNSSPAAIDQLISSYVSFSGKTFPHILVPLLEQQGLMINPLRPLVIYESMLIELDTTDFTDLTLTLDTENTHLDSNGKRGKIRLAFNLLDQGVQVGRGEKHMVLGGLKPFDQHATTQLIEGYTQRKAEFKVPPESPS